MICKQILKILIYNTKSGKLTWYVCLLGLVFMIVFIMTVFISVHFHMVNKIP